MKKLRIAQVAPLWYTIPPKKYGGVERIAALTTDELVKRGHDVTLFAAPGSRTKAQCLMSVCGKPLREAGVSWDNRLWEYSNLARAVRMAGRGEFDIVHNHIDMAGVLFSGLNKVPVLNTFHSGLYLNKAANEYYDTRYKLFKERRNGLSVAFISRRMRDIAGFKFKNSWVVYNGIDISKFRFDPTGGDHYIWIGRIEKKKGIENAIAVARSMDLTLLIAGRIDEISRDYFKKIIKPELNKNVKYIGELTNKELPRFYGSAKALLYPIEWEEPFGLVMAEAMACGTPVVAFNRGSVQEVVKDGKTGFVVNNMGGLKKAVKSIARISRNNCRRWAEQRFTVEKMVDRYEAIYRSIL